MQDDGAGRDAPAEQPAPRPEQAPAAPPAQRGRLRPRLPMLVAILLTVPILVVTFTKEPEPEGPVSFGDMREHYGWHGATLLLFDTLERQFPADFAGSQVGSDDRHSGWVGFRAAVPPGAQVVLAAYRADSRNGTVEVGENLGFTAAELRNRVASAQAAVGEQGAGTVQLDERTGVLEVDGAPADEGFRAALLEAIDARLAQRVEEWQEGDRATDEVQPVRFTQVATPSPS